MTKDTPPKDPTPDREPLPESEGLAPSDLPNPDVPDPQDVNDIGR